MPFFNRPNLDDIQFKQLSGTTLTLSGTTDFVGNLMSKGTVIDAYTGYTGTSIGNVLTLDTDGVIKLKATSSSGSSTFDGARPITQRAACPALAGNVGGTSVSEFLVNYFFPAVPPSSSLSVATGYAGGSISASCRQFGDCSTGNLCWNVTCCTYPITVISGTTCNSCIIFTGGTIGTTGSTVAYSYSFACAIPAVAVASSSTPFTLYGKTCCNEVTTSNASIVWKDRRYWGGKPTNYIGCSSGTTNAGVNTFCASELSSTGSKCFSNFCVGTNNFFYYAYPTVFGLPTQITVNGLPNNAWGCAAIGTLSTFKRCNTNGYCQDFYLLRSDSQISGSFNINITTVS